jgi:serine/threonine-protein kinase
MYAVLSSEIRPPSAHRSDVPTELDEIVLKALQRNPDERWQSAREMGRALRRFLAKQEELVGPAELADWMAELFPNGESRKRQLMELARTSDASGASDPPRRARDESNRRSIRIPPTGGRRMPSPPPVPASLLVIVIGAVTALTVVALDWLRQ